MREYVKSSGREKKSPFLHLINPATGQPNPNVKFYVHSNDPDDFADNEVDIPSVITELTYNFKLYHVDRKDPKTFDWFTFTSLPDDIRLIINTIRTNVGFSAQAGVQVTLSCCLTLGLTRLNASSSIKRLSKLRLDFNKRKKDGTPVERFINQFLDMEIPIQADIGRKVKLPITMDTKKQILSIADDTGLTQSSVGILAMYATLVQQESDTPPNYRQSWQDKLDQSLESIECKVRATKAIMKMLK